MGLNDMPAAERVHIAFFGCTNAGKSSVINAVTGQALSIVSDVKGTTTDPVRKTMELLPLGPVVLIDTPGIDDTGTLGAQRVERTRRVLDETDLAVLVVDAAVGMTAADRQTLEQIKKKQIPVVICYNKSDLASVSAAQPNEIAVSAKTGEGIHALKELLARFAKREETRPIAADLVPEGGAAVLVIPIDAGAPKGRLILPQQQTIRDLLEHGRLCVTVRDTELPQAMALLGARAKLVITDSQKFGAVAKTLDPAVPLTSFSILFLRYKGELAPAVAGARALDTLRDGDTVLICEGCTHHRQCEDIGTVKLPKWIGEYTQKKLKFQFTSGTEFPRDLSSYALIVHCGGCMLNRREMQSRIAYAQAAGVPMTNYGVAIAKMNGILSRALLPLGYKAD